LKPAPGTQDLETALQHLRGFGPACDDDETRPRNARAALESSLARMRSVGFECDLTQTVVGDIARVSLSYGRPGVERRVIEDGWRVGERDNEAILLSWWAFEMRKVADSC
jgi:hypothetical protein